MVKSILNLCHAVQQIQQVSTKQQNIHSQSNIGLKLDIIFPRANTSN